MRAYLSVSYNNRKALDKELSVLKSTLIQIGIEPFVFVDHYNFDSTQEHEMMQQAMKDIDDSIILIAEVSHKGIGIGVEVGYAKAKMKPIIYIRHKDADHSTTVSGISDFQIIYENTVDLHKLFFETMIEVCQSLKTA